MGPISPSPRCVNRRTDFEDRQLASVDVDTFQRSANSVGVNIGLSSDGNWLDGDDVPQGSRPGGVVVAIFGSGISVPRGGSSFFTQTSLC